MVYIGPYYPTAVEVKIEGENEISTPDEVVGDVVSLGLLLSLP